LSKEREDFASLAKNLMTTVNVDSERARQERKALLQIGGELDAQLWTNGQRLLVCGGHGTISTIETEGLRTFGEVKRYDVADHFSVK
jgi:hypothetical protein